MAEQSVAATSENLLPQGGGKRQNIHGGGKDTFFGKYSEEFQKYSVELDGVKERRERLVKASRDVTIHSKKVIFQLHRAVPANREAVLGQASLDLEWVRENYIVKIAEELQGEDYWRFRQAYTNGMQEYIEAATFFFYCVKGELLSLEELNSSLSILKDAGGNSFEACLEDYLLGVADLTGELMRLAVSSVAGGQREVATSVRDFLQLLHMAFCRLEKNGGREMSKKLSVMHQSLMKVEKATYMVHVRGSEYPSDILANQLEELNGRTGQDVATTE